MAEECYTLIPGIYWDLEGSTPHVYGKGTGAGAFAVPALAEGVRHFGQAAELKAIFTEACTVYDTLPP